MVHFLTVSERLPDMSYNAKVDGISAQNTYSGVALTFLKAAAAHLSKTFLDERHLFSLKSLAAMQPLEVLTSSAQN